jgi:hypothetical protein
MSDIIELAPVLDISCRDMPRMERLGPCTLLIFTVKDTSAYNEGERVVVAKLIVPTENPRARRYCSESSPAPPDVAAR